MVFAEQAVRELVSERSNVVVVHGRGAFSVKTTDQLTVPAHQYRESAIALGSTDARTRPNVARGPLVPFAHRADTPGVGDVAGVALGDAGRDDVERYAAYRVGYHRGLDALRANGWRGSGYVRWREPGNVGFLRCLEGLGAMARRIGELDEAERVEVFLAQLDPDGSRPR